MDEPFTPQPTPHPAHHWTTWWPKDRATLYRYCLHRWCPAVQEKPARV